MYNIAKLSVTDRKTLFQNTAEKKGLHPAIVEKDFWVCLTLKYLFENSDWKDKLIFKGGTSLSKAYHIIERFSEDIDLILSWDVINYDNDDPWKDRSRTQQDKYNKQMNEDTQRFLESSFVPSLVDGLVHQYGINLEIVMDGHDEQVVNIRYPQLFQDQYLRDEVRLEIGPLAEGIPSHTVPITSFAAEEYGRFFEAPSAQVNTVDAERTFWEKTTILHKVANRDTSKAFPARYARHYYDLYCLSRSEIKSRAFSKKELLDQDVVFKKKFYYSGKAGYDTAKTQSIKLLPMDSDLPALKEDYTHMANMIYGVVPDFSNMLSALKGVEEEIHQL